MVILSTLIRQIGLTGCVFLLMLGFYEGVPVLRDIPVVRELFAGRVQTAVTEAREAALKGYVLRSEKEAAEALAAELLRQRDAVAQALEGYRKRAEADRIAEKISEEQMEKAIVEDTSDDGSHWTDADRIWLCSQRNTPDCRR